MVAHDGSTSVMALINLLLTSFRPSFLLSYYIIFKKRAIFLRLFFIAFASPAIQGKRQEMRLQRKREESERRKSGERTNLLRPNSMRRRQPVFTPFLLHAVWGGRRWFLQWCYYRL
jgi:hypothetical protein